MHENKTVALHRVLRTAGITILVVLIGLWVVMTFVLRRQNSAPAESLTTVTSSEESPSDAVSAYPEEAAFTQSYFDQIQRGNYQALLDHYWLADVPDSIVRQCSSPLDDAQNLDPESLWRNCAYFHDLTVSIVSFEAREDNSILARIQFTDRDGSILGSALHPEWTMGHQFIIQKTDEGLKTGDWYFIN